MWEKVHNQALDPMYDKKFPTLSLAISKGPKPPKLPTNGWPFFKPIVIDPLVRC